MKQHFFQAAGFPVLISLLLTLSAQGARQRQLQGHVPAAVAGLQAVDRLPATNHLRLSIGLPLRNRPALTNLLEELYKPGSPQFHKYLSVEEFTSRFGPSAEDYQKAGDFARAHGLTVTRTHPNRMVLEVEAPVAAIEAAFQVHLRVYEHPTERRRFYAPDAEPTVDADVPVQDVMGLDNYVLPHPMNMRVKPLAAGGNPGVVAFAEQGSGPGGTFIGNDFRAAYVAGVTNRGDGQMIGLMEFGPYYTNDVHTYETTANLSTNIVVRNIFLDGVTLPPSAGTDAGEQALDIEMSISMAPAATVLYYGGEVVNDILNRIATDNLARQISCSFGFGIDSTSEQIYQEFVAQGQNYFQASGDAGAYSGAIDPPAAEPYVTICGGTALSTVTPGGAWQSESAWVGSGGGISTAYAIPSWQQGISMAANGGSTTMRNFPDVAMMADTVIFIAANNGTGAVGGTSASTPLWAGFDALVNQQAAALGLPAAGFLNPALYALGKSASYGKCFHDITTGNTTNFSNPTRFFARVGYDLCTGWGTPIGSNLISALAAAGGTNLMLYASPAAMELTQGGSGAVLITIQPVNGFTGAAELSITNLPVGVTASLSSSNTASTSLLTLSASAGATPGSATATITATAGALTQTSLVYLSIVAATPGTTEVNLASVYNVTATVSDGRTFGNGADGGGHAYSASLLGPALSWNGCLFNTGSANANDAVQCLGQTIALPEGNYCSIQILGTAVDGTQTGQTFTVTYTDGSKATFTQSLSDWTAALGYPGESVVASMAYRDINNGTEDTVSHANVYGYSFGLNNTKTVQSLKLPYNSDVLVMGMTLANDFPLYAMPVAWTITGGGSAVSLITAQPVGVSGGNVALSLAGLAPGMSASFNPSSAPSNSLLTFTTSVSTFPASTTITITGALNGISHTITMPVTVIGPIPGSAVASLASDCNVEAIVTDGATFGGGLDGNGNAYSATLLGTKASWNGCVFATGPANACDAIQCAGQTVALPQRQSTSLLMLATAVNAAQLGQVFTVNYTDGTSAIFTQNMSDWRAAGNYGGESIAFAMSWSDTNSGASNTNAPVNLYGYSFPLNDSRTIQSVTLPDNPDVVVLGLAVANAPTAVALSGAFNRAGIYTDGTSFTGGGLDNDGSAYSANLLGSSQAWSSVVFNFGASNAVDAVKCTGQQIALPTNRYTGLLLLGAAVNGNQAAQTFVVSYADGTTATLKQSISDWANPQNYPGEATVAAMNHRDTSSGGIDGTTVNLYGYWLPLNNTKVARSITLPNNNNVEVLAMSLVNTPLPAPLAAAFNRAGIYTDGSTFPSTNGLDGGGYSYSANALGSFELWNAALFEIGPPNVSNIVSGAGQVVALPPGQYGSLMLLGAGVDGNQSSQVFRVTYTNGAQSAFTQSMSDWASPQHYAGETIVAAMGYRNQAGGGRAGPPVNLYGYTFNLIASDVAQSVTLPANGNLVIAAITLSNVTIATPEAPAIVTQPGDVTVTNGYPANFAVEATGSPPLTYQWQWDGTDLPNGGGISGATTDDLALTAAAETNAGSYTVIVGNNYGSVTSMVASLTVVIPPIVFQTAMVISNTVSFSWSAAPGLNYQTQYTTDLSSSNWIDLGSVVGATNGTLSTSDQLGPDPQRFYRVVLVPSN